MKNKKVLFLTPQLPYPPISGGTIKSFKLVKHLSEEFNLTVFCLLKGRDYMHVEEFQEVVELDDFYSYENLRPRTAINFLKSILYQLPLSVFRNYSPVFKKYIKPKLNDFDHIIVDHFLMFQYIPKELHSKVIYHAHNAEYVMWEKFGDEQNNPLKKYALYFEAWRIKHYERMICEKSRLVFAAPNDIENLATKGIQTSKFQKTYHLGDDILLNEPELSWDDEHKRILYVGTLSWEANQDGLRWFLINCWPKIKTQTDAHFDIIGRGMPEDIQVICANEERITYHDFVEDLRPYYSQSHCFVAPLRFGSGIKVKVFNSMYRGLPLVTTCCGVEGIDVVNREHLLVSNTPGDFSKGVIDLLSEKELWNKLRVNSRDLAKEKYTWDNVLSEVAEVCYE